MIMDENCSGELDMNTVIHQLLLDLSNSNSLQDEILKNFDPPYPASNILASQNLVLKLNLQHERKIRINIENQSRYLNDKLSEATLGLKEAKEKLLAIQKTTKDMIVTRDNREELLQKLFAMNKMYEEKYGRIQVNEIDIDLNNSFQALLQHKEMEVRLKDVKIRELEVILSHSLSN